VKAVLLDILLAPRDLLHAKIAMEIVILDQAVLRAIFVSVHITTLLMECVFRAPRALYAPQMELLLSRSSQSINILGEFQVHQ
jgi:hypothetical protein